MKKRTSFLFLISVFIFSISMSFAQTADSKWALGAGFGQKDYAGGLGFRAFNRFNPNGSLAIHRYLSPSFDLSLVGSTGDFKYREKNANSDRFDSQNTDVNLQLKYKFYNDKIIAADKIGPYLLLGAGFTSWQMPDTQDYIWTPNFNGGLGLRFPAGEIASFFIQTVYHYTLNDNVDLVNFGDFNDAYFHHSLGFNFNLAGKKDADKDGISDRLDTCPNTPTGVRVDGKGCPIDSDADGIADFEDDCPSEAGIVSVKGCPDSDNDGVKNADDKCPTVAGLSKFQGCPDSDNDGIQDSEDKCPNIAGVAGFQGCPDSDNDGIQDSEDKCPNVKGVAAFGGCADSDGDGVADPDDQCPNKAGSKNNKGCPEIKIADIKRIETAIKGIQFETGSAKLKPTSFAALNQAADVLKSDASYKLNIEGHTDNVGDPARNLKLSKDRANAVKDYIVSKGIDGSRISAEGYGSEKPIADNKTPQGRQQNRRVDLKLSF